MFNFRRGALRLFIGLILLSLLRAPVAAQQVEPAYDVVIRNGRVLDGAGNPWIRADVAIKNGRFARIGRVVERGRQEIDATGRYVSPGWIDVMDQSGRALMQNGLAENKLMMGVTTAIGGEGGTPVPADKIAEYFAGLEKTGISMNFGSDAAASLTPNAVDTLGLGHPRGYGNFPRLIARYVREKRVLTLEQAIRKMTSWPATRMRLNSRGVIKEGAWADVVIFDYETIQDRATYEKPFVYPTGIDYVLVNGQVVIDRGKHTGARPGHVMYGPGRSSQNANLRGWFPQRRKDGMKIHLPCT